MAGRYRDTTTFWRKNSPGLKMKEGERESSKRMVNQMRRLSLRKAESDLYETIDEEYKKFDATISTQQECGEREEKPDYTRLSTLWEEKDGLPGGDAGEEVCGEASRDRDIHEKEKHDESNDKSSESGGNPSSLMQEKAKESRTTEPSSRRESWHHLSRLSTLWEENDDLPDKDAGGEREENEEELEETSRDIPEKEKYDETDDKSKESGGNPSSLVEEKARQSSHKDVCHHLSTPDNPDKSKIVSISLDPSKKRQVEYGEYGGHSLVTLAPPKTKLTISGKKCTHLTLTGTAVNPLNKRGGGAETQKWHEKGEGGTKI